MSADFSAVPLRHHRLHPLAGVGLAAGQCLALQKPWSSCTECAEVCPETCLSITPEGLQLDGARCSGCGRCATRCPTRALTVEGLAVPAPSVRSKRLRLACTRQRGGADVTVNCLLGLGTVGLLQAMAQTDELVLVDGGQCASCRNAGNAPVGIGDLVASVHALLTDHGIATSRLTRVDLAAGALLPDGNAKPSAGPDVPARRAFFGGLGRAASRGVQARLGAAPLPPLPAAHYRGSALPGQHAHALRHALKTLCEGATPVLRGELPTLDRVAPCDGCGICVRVCPSDALKSPDDTATWSLEFTAARCTGCAACVRHCPSGALSSGVAGGQSLDAVAVVLARHPRRFCGECGDSLLVGAPEDLCPACTARTRLARAGFGLGRPAAWTEVRRSPLETGPPAG